MIRYLADENLNRHIIRGLLGRAPQVRLILAQEAGLGVIAACSSAREWENQVVYLPR